ncbi:Thioesterase-like protein 1 [Elsinoe fawcettii]|nr:Thioesterase-like protein 1 [Elsinoe fawcettii]
MSNNDDSKRNLPPDTPVSTFASSHRYFQSHPWTAELLSAPSLCLHLPSSRHPKRSTEDSLFAVTLASSQTISHILAFHALPSREEQHINECTTLVALGNDLNGFPKILHGGIIMTLIDEAMGILLNVDLDRKHFKEVAVGKKDGEWSEGLELFTSKLNTKFLSPVETPGVVAIRVKTTSREGRKTQLVAEVIQWRNKTSKGDGMGWSYGQGEGEEIICARGEGEFVKPRSNKL